MATITFEYMLQHSRDLKAIYEEEDELSVIAIALIWDKTADYNLDINEVASDGRQEDHEMIQNRLQRVQRAYNARRAELEYKCLVNYLGLDSTG